MIRMFEFELPTGADGTGKFPETNYRTMIHTPLDPVMRYKRRVPKSG